MEKFGKKKKKKATIVRFTVTVVSTYKEWIRPGCVCGCDVKKRTKKKTQNYLVDLNSSNFLNSLQSTKFRKVHDEKIICRSFNHSQ